MWLNLKDNLRQKTTDKRLKVFVERSLVFGLWSSIFLTGCASWGTYNAATGRHEFIIIPTTDEIAMGENINQDLRRQYKFVDEGPQLDRLRRIGLKVAQVSDRQDFSYHFYLIEAKELNAFTVPGGSVYMYTGLMDKLATDDQIASVLAHEIGHCAARHTVKKFQAALGYNLIGNLVLGQIESQATQDLAALTSGMVMNVVFSAYSRHDEYEADKLGVKYTYLSGYDPNASVESLEILQKEMKGLRMPLILQSHPFLEDRIKEVKKEIPLVKGEFEGGMT